MQYYLAVAGQQYGPLSSQQLLAQQLPAGALIWREGLSQWLPLEHVPELQAARQRPATPTPPTPPPLPGSLAAQPVSSSQPGPASPNTGWTWNELRSIAASQRRLIMGVGASGLAYFLGLPAISVMAAVAGTSAGLPAEAIKVLDGIGEWSFILVLCGLQVWLAVGVAQSLRLANAWLWGVGSCLCCVGLIVLLVLNQQATTALQRAGISVGFLGTVLPEHPPK